MQILPLENFSLSLEYLKDLLMRRLSAFQQGNGVEGIAARDFKLKESNDFFTKTVILNKANIFEFITLLLALAPHLNSDFFDQILTKHFSEGNHFPAFGGVRGRNHRGILPTGETAQFILAGNEIQKRMVVQALFSSDHWFSTKNILKLEEVPEGEPLMSGRLILDSEWLEKLTTGGISSPRFSTRFPAEQLTTSLTWEDLVLQSKTLTQIQELEIWANRHSNIKADWNLSRHLKPGYRALFHGPPGTGKTLTASLLGQSTGKPVFRVDLSMVISKYIGETEKNLAGLFDKASHKNWILFFDEADALFGKRTETRDAHDKYANQEVSYLLQRVENYPGLVILASNFRSNVDAAFARRFQSIIHFPFPKPEQRQQLWNKVIPKDITLDPAIDFKKIASQYELSGSNIVNIVQYCVIQFLEARKPFLSISLLMEGIRREYAKEERLI
jgi:hypothetical protein